MAWRKICLFIILLLGLFLWIGCQATAGESTAVPPTTTSRLPASPTAVPISSIAPPPATLTPAPLPMTASPTAAPNYPLYDGQPLEPDKIGIQILLREQDQDELFVHLQALGVGWVKIQISWKLYQPEPGEYHEQRFAELDEFINTANTHHINVLLGVSKAPEWSRPTTEMDGPPADFSLYRSFMAFLARRYQNRVQAYELWNEPNLQREWNGMSLNAADFVVLLREGNAGVRTADPQAILISGAPATTGINDGLTAVDDRVFLRQMLAAGAADVVDVIGVHPYGWANPPDSSFANPNTAVPSHNNHPSFFFQDTLNDYGDLLAEFNLDKPMWITEFGWGSFDGFDSPPPAGAEFMNYVSEWQQALYTLRAFEIAQMNPQIGPVILWNLNFGPLLGNEFSLSGYSLLRPDGTKRPLYFALGAALSR
jgi:hypothetical protein